MVLHTSNQLFVVLKPPRPQDVDKTGKLWQRNVTVLSAARAAINRLVVDNGVLGPDDLAIAVSRRWIAGRPQRCADDLLHDFAGALETVRTRNTVDQNVIIDRPFDRDDVVDHGAKVTAVSHVIETLTIGYHDDARIGLNVENDQSSVGFDGIRSARVKLGLFDRRGVVGRFGARHGKLDKDRRPRFY